MMPKMMVMVVMVIAVLSMVPRRVRAMNRVRSVGGSQRQRVHPLYHDDRGERGSCNTSEAEDRFGFTRAGGSPVCGWSYSAACSSDSSGFSRGEREHFSL